MLTAWRRQPDSDSHRRSSNLMMILLAVLLCLLQKVQIYLLWVQSHTLIFFSPKGTGPSLFISMLYLLINQTLILLYVLFDLLSAFSFWIISFRMSKNPSSMQRHWPLRFPQAYSFSPSVGDQFTFATPIICDHGGAKKTKKIIGPHHIPEFIFPGHQCDTLEAHRSSEAWKGVWLAQWFLKLEDILHKHLEPSFSWEIRSVNTGLLSNLATIDQSWVLAAPTTQGIRSPLCQSYHHSLKLYFLPLPSFTLTACLCWHLDLWPLI